MSKLKQGADKDQAGQLNPVATLAMCRPEYFGVSYTINPWMDPKGWKANPGELLARAHSGWQKMYETFLSLGVAVKLIAPQPALPDFVFTANGAIVLDGKVLLARFRHAERQGEEKHFARFFKQLQKQKSIEDVSFLPENIWQEGAGDCTWDRERKIFWAGYGQRSSVDSIPYIKEYFGKPVVALELASERFYHIDISLCPLAHGDVLYYPGAFTQRSLALITETVSPEQLIAVSREDAENFAINLVNWQDKIVLNNCSARLEKELSERDYKVVKVPVETFAMAGGSVCCMTLRLDNRSA